jgi:hypothetical protein
MIRVLARTSLPALTLAAACLAPSALGATSHSVRLNARLSAKQQNPPQVVKTPHAAGQFSATIKLQSKQATLSWSLSFSGLSGKPTHALILLPARGKNGEVAFDLCNGKKCVSGMKQLSILPVDIAKQLSTRAGYVTIKTAKNKHGETSGKLAHN